MLNEHTRVYLCNLHESRQTIYDHVLKSCVDNLGWKGGNGWNTSKRDGMKFTNVLYMVYSVYKWNVTGHLLKYFGCNLQFD